MIWNSFLIHFAQYACALHVRVTNVLLLSQELTIRFNYLCCCFKILCEYQELNKYLINVKKDKFLIEVNVSNQFKVR